MNPELVAWIKEHQLATAAGDTAQAQVALGMIRSLNRAANQQDFQTAEAPMNPLLAAGAGLGTYALGPPIGQAGSSYATDAGGAPAAAAQAEAENQQATYEAAQGTQPYATYAGEVGPLAFDAASSIAALRDPRVLRAIARVLPKEVGGDYLRHVAQVRELTPLSKVAQLEKPITEAERARLMLERTQGLKQQTEANIARAAELHPERVKTATANAETAQGRAKIMTEKITDPRRGQARADAYERMRLKTEMMRKQAESMGVGVSPLDELALRIQKANPSWTMDQARGAARAAQPGLLGESGGASLPGLLGAGAAAAGAAAIPGLLSRPSGGPTFASPPAQPIDPEQEQVQQYERIANDPRFTTGERIRARQYVQQALNRALKKRQG